MKYCLSILVLLFVSISSGSAQVKGRVDAGYVDLQMNLLESGKTINKLWMGGGRVDSTIVPFEGYGVALKTSTTAVTGDGDMFNNSLGLGHYTPINDRWTLVPAAGWTYTHLSSMHDIPSVGLYNIREKIRSNSVYIGTDIIFKINEEWYLTGVVQYAWARSTTFLGTKGRSSIFAPNFIIPFNQNVNGSSSGLSGAAIVDYYFREDWSFNVAFGYNSTLSEERHGLRVLGWKAGMSYTF